VFGLGAGLCLGKIFRLQFGLVLRTNLGFVWF